MLYRNKEIIAEGTYNMGDGKTPLIVEDKALLQTKKATIRQAGTYIESYSKVENLQLISSKSKTKMLIQSTEKIFNSIS